MKQNKNSLYTFLVLLLMINFNINAQNKSNSQSEVEEIEEVEEVEKPQSIQFRFIENPPIFLGCENTKGKEAKNCMSKNVVTKSYKNLLLKKLEKKNWQA